MSLFVRDNPIIPRHRPLFVSLLLQILLIWLILRAWFFVFLLDMYTPTSTGACLSKSWYMVILPRKWAYSAFVS